MKIVYHPKALHQLDEILSYIEERSPKGARSVAARIKRSIDQLAEFPLSGRASEVASIRELPIVQYPYIIFYSVDDASEEVFILRIRHASRDPASQLD